MYKNYATPDQVKEIHDRVSGYKYGYRRKLQSFTQFSYRRFVDLIRIDKIPHYAYIDIIKACSRFEKKHGKKYMK